MVWLRGGLVAAGDPDLRSILALATFATAMLPAPAAAQPTADLQEWSDWLGDPVGHSDNLAWRNFGPGSNVPPGSFNAPASDS